MLQQQNLIQAKTRHAGQGNPLQGSEHFCLSCWLSRGEWRAKDTQQNRGCHFPMSVQQLV